MQLSAHGVSFEIDDNAAGSAVFMLGVRKCGSSMFNRIAMMLSSMNGRNFVDVAGRLFEHDVRTDVWLNDDAVVGLLRSGNVYGGFREYPARIAASKVYKDAKKIFLYRDPRDALVSEYFSTAYSHSLPNKVAAEGTGGVRDSFLAKREQARSTHIDEHVVKRAKVMRRTVEPFINVLRDPSAACFKYEDIIFEKAQFIADIVAHLGWRCTDAQVAAILEKVDLRVVEEDPTKFVRHVTPGDHREKLSPETIAAINMTLADILDVFGYPR